MSESIATGSAATAGMRTPAPQDGRALRYRPDIDGLRALAILPILLLHCGVTRLRGGFVGVDIFFVISGFLITAIMVRDIAEARFSILRFYRHRIVRILPALLVMMTVILALGCVILLPNQLRDLGRSAAATSVFGSNVYFYLTSDYFAAASDAKPLVHTWSLAVEEQFYLLYPLLLWSLRGLSRQRLAQVIAGLAVASFAIGGWLATAYPSAAFFLLPARIWELSLGALVALGAVPTIENRSVRATLCILAIAVIAASCVAISSGWPFPVPFALPPAVAAAVLLAYGAQGPTARLLGAWPLRTIGLISYSAYLWHRPIIAFYQIRHGSTLAPVETVGLLCASLGAAWLSFALVERPASRRWRSGSGLVPHAVAVVLLVAMAITGLTIAARADDIRPLSPRQALAASYLGWDSTDAGKRQFSTDRCFALPTGRPFSPDCLRLSATKPNIALLGDSHGAHFSQALRTLLPGANIVQATAAGCRPLLHGKGLPICRTTMDAAFGTLDFARIDTVVLSARWLDFEQPALLDTIRWLRAHGTRVLVIGPSVEYDADLPALIVRSDGDGNSTLADGLRLMDRIALDRAMAGPVRAAGADYASAIETECTGKTCRLTTADGTPLHFDHSHFTPAGARDTLAVILAHHPVIRRP
ncbi:acyltransferase family protein [Sphingomonas faeni]|uniref:acyltransferase family protein n=1 Tax=Sphingomonas faeni TaxID=185950 RepID=UPI0020C762BB|nr:acyltransferase [Sphingomonas faeni]